MESMHLRVGVAFCLALWLGTTAAFADTYYKYRDQRTGRDVFVNRLEQVPRRYRGSATVVLETEQGAGEAAEAQPTEVIDSPPPPGRPTLHTVSPPAPPTVDFRQAWSGNDPWKHGPEVVGNALDAKLATSGAPPLTGAERHGLGRLLVSFVVAAIVAGIAALVAWLALIIVAFRNNHPWWGVFIFLFWPLGYVYLFLHVGKGRALWKSLGVAAMLSPALVGLVGAWRFYAWFQAVAQARGGHL